MEEEKIEKNLLEIHKDKHYRVVDYHDTVYVQKWFRSQHAHVFRLSNNINQLYFEDNTELLIDYNSKSMTYIDKDGETCRGRI